MKTKLVLAVIVGSMITFAACHSSTKQETKSTEQAVKVQYTCSMHPEVISDKPGKCPKCGMDLVIK